MGDSMKIACSIVVTLFLLASAATAQSNINERLQVDATDAPRNILHAIVTVPVTPGAFTLVYPKWLPGNHRPTGPIQNLTGLHLKAGGTELDWQRDLVDMWAFHVQVPAGVTELQASFDTITYNGKSSLASSKVLDLVWNQVLLYPQGAATDAVQVTASVRLPEGWKFGTALTPAQQSGNAAEFQPVTLTKLVDSPLIAGAIYRQVQLSPTGETPVHVIDLVGESEESVQMTDKDVASLKQLVAETGKLFGARHYEKYHFLLILGDQTAHHGLEHHESSDNGAAEDMFSNPDSHDLEADLLPHEFTLLEWQVSPARGPGHGELSGPDEGRPALGIRRTHALSGQHPGRAHGVAYAGPLPRKPGLYGRHAGPSRRTHVASATGHSNVCAEFVHRSAGMDQLAPHRRLLS